MKKLLLIATLMKIRPVLVVVLIGISGMSEGYDQDEELAVVPGIIGMIDVCYPEIKKESEFGNKPERMQRFQFYDFFKILEIAEKLNLYKLNPETGELVYMQDSEHWDTYAGVFSLGKKEMEKGKQTLRELCEPMQGYMIALVAGYIYGTTGDLVSMPGGLPFF